jgi:iron complex outermembrane receptor protein
MLAVTVAFDVHLMAQAGVTLTGRLLNSLSGAPVAGATVQLDEVKRTTTSGADGTFSFTNVPAGTYHVSIHSQGYSTRRSEIVVGTSDTRADLTVDPELHFEEVTTVTGFARSQFEAFQATTVLSGQELSKQLEMSLGGTLETQPGVASRTFGPAPGRPVIRGLDGDRVQILQDGQRMSDLSSQSGDHGVTINPAVAERIEVVRGPATLLYGPSAIGGLVNIITEDIPTRPLRGATGNVTFDVGSAAKEGGAAANVRAGNGSFAIHAAGGGRRSGDVRTPDGDLGNSQSRNGFGNLGASWTSERGYVGASYGYDDTKYGVPIVEEGLISLTPRRHSFSVRGGAQNLAGGLDSWRATFTGRRYEHDELEGDEVGTAFKNNTEEVELMASHRTLGRMKGSFGSWFLNRAFGAAGAEALSPDVDQRGLAAFLYEEVGWPHVTVQFAGRLDHTTYEPAGEDERSFTSGSGSVGLLFTPRAADERLTFAVSLARVGRSPALDELFYFGAHPGNFAFEIGNPDLEPEHPVGLDVSMRWRAPRASGEITYFRNDIQRFVFRRPVSLQELADRGEEFAERFPNRALDTEAAEELPVIENIGADTVLQGIELHSDFGLTSELSAEVTLDYVRGTVKETDQPLPRMPPFRTNVGLRYQRNAFQAGGNVIAAAKQDRLFAGEATTDGYALLKLYAAYSIAQGKAVHTITARLDNATDTLYRNHLSLIKDLAAEMGANVRLIYNVRF